MRVAEQGNRVGAPIDLGGAPTSLAVGDGAVWVVDPAQGVLERLDAPGGASPEPIDVGAGAGPVAYGRRHAVGRAARAPERPARRCR